MGDRYRNIRRAQRAAGPYKPAHRRRPPPPSWSVPGILATTAGFGAIVFLAAPSLESLWRTTTMPAAQLAATEASVHYAGCDEARAAGTAPIYRGSPGYRPEMDGDGDGIACEPYR